MRERSIQFLRDTLKRGGSTLTYHTYGTQRLDDGGCLYTYRIVCGITSIGHSIADVLEGIALGPSARCIEKKPGGLIVSPLDSQALTDQIGRIAPHGRALTFRLIVERDIVAR